MIEFVNQNCCYGKKPANEMNIQKALGLTALHVSMVTLVWEELVKSGFSLRTFKWAYYFKKK